MNNTPDDGIYVDVSNQPNLQYTNNAFYNTASSSSSAGNEASFSNFSSSSYVPETSQHHGNLSSTYNVHQRQQGTFGGSESSRHTLPSNLNFTPFYPPSSNQDTEHTRIASYPSTAYSTHLSSQFNGLSAADTSNWYTNNSLDYRSSTISDSNSSWSAARNSGTSFATTISSTRSSFVSNDTYDQANYEAFPSIYVGSNEVTQPAVTAPAEGDPGRPFQCTFHCGKTFAKKHEWQRHENSLHEIQWQYICEPEIIYPGMECIFCQCIADQSHFELNHQNRLCQELDDKCKHTFARKDKFQLHVQNKHCPNTKSKKQWQKWARPTKPRPEGYGCGFCREPLPTWSTRAKHLGDHFEKDAHRVTMDQWDKAFDVGTYGHGSQSQHSRYSSHTSIHNTDFYAESKALSDGESQAHTPPDSRNRVPRKRTIPKAIANSNRRPSHEETDTYMDDDPGGETLFGDDTDYIMTT